MQLNPNFVQMNDFELGKSLKLINCYLINGIHKGL